MEIQCILVLVGTPEYFYDSFRDTFMIHPDRIYAHNLHTCKLRAKLYGPLHMPQFNYHLQRREFAACCECDKADSTIYAK